MSVLPEYGPTLPELVSRRFGLPPRRAALILAGSTVALILLALVIRGGDGRKEFAHTGEAAFTLRYPTHLMKPQPLQDGELAHFVTRRGSLEIDVVITGADFPGKRFSDLPIVAALRADGLRREIPGVEFREEGRTRLSRQPAYEINYRYGAPQHRVAARDVLLFPDETGLRHGAVIQFRTTNAGKPLTESDRDAIKAVRRGAHSLLFESAPR